MKQSELVLTALSGLGVLGILVAFFSIHSNSSNVSGGKAPRKSREYFKNNERNVLGSPMSPCSTNSEKVTGYFRDGYCSTDATDRGTHVVCSVVDDAFLQFTKGRGNDLSTPHPPSFPGLVEGDKWCLCANRWMEAYKAGKAPKIILESTKDSAIRFIPKDIIMKSQ